jgi:hypothetical protein
METRTCILHIARARYIRRIRLGFDLRRVFCENMPLGLDRTIASAFGTTTAGNLVSGGRSVASASVEQRWGESGARRRRCRRVEERKEMFGSKAEGLRNQTTASFRFRRFKFCRSCFQSLSFHLRYTSLKFFLPWDLGLLKCRGSSKTQDFMGERKCFGVKE